MDMGKLYKQKFNDGYRKTIHPGAIDRGYYAM
jgi:hypothetical protein